MRTLGHQNAQFGTNRAFVGRAVGVGAGAALGAAAVTHAQFAHNQFAAHNFHGLHNFNRTGFNRNAFGNGAGWHHWGGRFYGAGWNNWGNGWGGWAGPVFWPFLLGDIFSFALWPYGYYDPFWAYGPASSSPASLPPDLILDPNTATDPPLRVWRLLRLCRLFWRLSKHLLRPLGRHAWL